MFCPNYYLFLDKLIPLKMKYLVTFLLTFILISCTSSVKGEYDTRAVESLDNLTKTIGELTSCSYTVDSYLVNEEGEETEKLSDVYLKGSNKIFIKNTGDKGNKSFWYNGKDFSYFLFDKNEYDIIKAPENTLTLIDSINSHYGIYIPAADFLYPTLTDDILDNYDQLLYFGEENIDDINCILLEASNNQHTLQIWIEKESNLPHKMAIISKISDKKYYEAVYSNWRINPKLPDVMFEFQAPEGSVQKKFIPKK